MSLALTVLLLMLVVTLLLRLPIGFGMLISGVAYLLVKRQDLGLVAEQVLNGMYNGYILLAVPLFIFAAAVMNSGTVSERLFEFALAIVGRLRGGLAHVNIIVSVIFSGMSGSAIADAAGPGIVSIRMMQKNGYSAEFAGALTAASSTIGPIIPPSIPMVIYALVSSASVGALFLGGVIPGLMMALALMLAVHFVAKKRNLPRGTPVPWRDYPRILIRGFLPLTLPVVLLGGIYSGVFTPTEAASVAALYALFLAGDRVPGAELEAAVRDPGRIVEVERVGHADHRVGVRHQLRVHRGKRAGAGGGLAHVDAPVAAGLPDCGEHPVPDPRLLPRHVDHAAGAGADHSARGERCSTSTSCSSA